MAGSKIGFALYDYLCLSQLKNTPWVSIFDPDRGPGILREVASMIERDAPQSLLVERFEKHAVDVEKSQAGGLSTLRTQWNAWLRQKAESYGIPNANSFCIQSRRIEGRTHYGVCLPRELLVTN